jgi:hypothetical protein
MLASTSHLSLSSPQTFTCCCKQQVLQNPHTKLNAKGWLRVTVWQGQLFASHVGTGQGSRDGVFLLALLELLQRANNNKLHGNGEGLPRVLILCVSCALK